MYYYPTFADHAARNSTEVPGDPAPRTSIELQNTITANTETTFDIRMKIVGMAFGLLGVFLGIVAIQSDDPVNQKIGIAGVVVGFMFILSVVYKQCNKSHSPAPGNALPPAEHPGMGSPA